MVSIAAIQNKSNYAICRSTEKEEEEEEEEEDVEEEEEEEEEGEKKTHRVVREERKEGKSPTRHPPCLVLTHFRHTTTTCFTLALHFFFNFSKPTRVAIKNRHASLEVNSSSTRWKG